MFPWIKSLIADMSAGSVLVTVSVMIVLALLVALGELATQESAGDAVFVAEDAASGVLGVAASDRESHPVQSHRSAVSVMVPAGGFR
jgi:hypothetical protein